MICIFALMLCFTEMEDDEELERMMLSISPSKLQGQLSKKTSHRHRCTGFCGLQGQNLFNNMGMTEVLQFEGVL